MCTGYHKQKDEHLKRLRRIEGQIRCLQRMVDEDVYCIDILTQVSASTKALQSFALQLLEEHLRHCVADAAVKGGAEIDAKGGGGDEGDRPPPAHLTPGARQDRPPAREPGRLPTGRPRPLAPRPPEAPRRCSPG